MDKAYDIVVIESNVHQHHIKRQIIVRTCLMNDTFTQVQKVLSRREVDRRINELRRRGR